MSSTQVRRNGPYAPLGANYADDDAIATLDIDEDDRTELLYLRGLAYCARDPRTEGYISDIALTAGKVLRRSPVRKPRTRGNRVPSGSQLPPDDTEKRATSGKDVADSVLVSAARLAELGLWTRDGDGYRVTAWLKWNKSWAEIDRSHARDRARKAGTDDGTAEESDRTSNGSRTDSARKPNGLPTPRHVTAQHGSSTADHGTADQGSSTPPPPAEPRGDGTREHLLDIHQADLGPLPAITAKALTRHLNAASPDATDSQLLAALAEWRRRPDAKPGLLPHLIGDELARPAPPDPDDPLAGLDPDARAWVEEQQALRAGAAR